MAVLGIGLTFARPGHAQRNDTHEWVPKILGAQFTLIVQHLVPFAAPYSGVNSLIHTGDTQGTHTYGIYLGSRITRSLEAYVDLEMARGAGVGHAVGLGGITNGDVIRQGNVDLGRGPYVARAFVRYRADLSEVADTISRAMDQLPGLEPVRRIEIDVGKLAARDGFDQNRYANTTRAQFCNWGLFNNTAWDFAADTRGYTYGVLVNWVHPRWSFALGTFLMPTFANGNAFDTDVQHAREDDAQLTLQLDTHGTTVRVLAYENHASMGNYAEAIGQGQGTGTLPDIAADDQAGRVKYGLGLSAELPIADSGESGMFVRLGWNDGRTEDFAFTEVDRHLSAGLQLVGTHWGRGGDRVGIGAVRHGLSPQHRAYLAAGGLGFLLGDGRLRYGSETIFEAYYRAQLGRYAQVSSDLQFIAHPGYNRDRGPASVLSVRLNLRY